MKKRKLRVLSTLLLGSFILVACQSDTNPPEVKPEETETITSKTKGEEYTEILSSTNWQGTKVYDASGTELTEENSDFIGLAKYDKDTGYYEFFDKETKESREDEGTFFITHDGDKRILISSTKNYQAVVDLTEVNQEIFTYKRMGKDKEGNDVEVFVEHIPYTDSELSFTNGRASLSSTTGTISSDSGSKILGERLWNGTVVLDEEGNDVTEFNEMFISLAKFNDSNSKYEFFNIESGESRKDFGYYDVIYNNKIRTHVSIGDNKYGAVLEITEINDGKFTYKRMGQDADGNEIVIFVEHEPYTGDHNPAFTF